MRIYTLVMAGLVLAAVEGRTETMRTTFTKENRLPERHKFEAGFAFDASGLRDNGGEEYAETLSLRFSVFRNAAVYGQIPVRHTSPEFGDDKAGFGDIVIGAELAPWQDIFNYPYILPYAEISFPSGDEDDGLGTGTTSATLGICLGTTAMDVFHYALDVSYTFNTLSRNVPSGTEKTGYATAALSFLWDLSKSFALRAEAKVTSEKGTEEDDDLPPMYFIGGMSFRPVESLMFTVYGGGAVSAREEVIGGIKAVFSF